MQWLFQQEGFVTRGGCGGWSAGLLVSDRMANLSIAIAYVIISATLYMVYRHSERPLVFRYLYPSFAAFIWACGVTHLLEWLATYIPMWHAVVAAEFLTAVASWAAIVSIILAAPSLLRLKIISVDSGGGV